MPNKNRAHMERGFFFLVPLVHRLNLVAPKFFLFELPELYSLS